uniref:Uncharacterized protein n=1 Tax=Acrobeloides nanus TaxID=290746 RepID=A0A914EM72_9BILA
MDSSTASPTSATKVVLRLPKLKPSGAGSSSTSKTSVASSTPTEPIARLSSGAPPSRKATSTFKTSEGRATPSSQSSIKHKSLGATLTSEEKRANKRKGDTRSSQGGAKEAKIPKKSPAEPPTTFPPTPQTLGFTTVGMASLKNFKIPKVQEDKPESPVTTVPPPSVTTTSATSSQESRPIVEPRDNIRPSQPPNPTGHFQQFPFNPPSNLGLPSSNFNIRRPAQPRSILKNAPPPDFGNPNMPPYRATTPTQQRKPFVNEPPPRGSFRGQPPVARPPNFNPPAREKALSMGVGGWMPILNPQQPYQTSSKERPNYSNQPVERDKSDQFSREVKDDSPSEQLQIDESE